MEIKKSHPFSQSKNGYKMSPYLQDQVAFTGQLDVYGQASQTIERLLRVKVSTSQAYRITDHYGKGIGDDIKASIPEFELEKGDNIYGQMDGGMVLTDDGWQEVKVGRIFRQSDIAKASQNTERQKIKESQYVAQLGSHTAFLETFGKAVQPYKKRQDRLVFINDGAVWIDNWIRENFPGATSILDFFHVTENLARVGKLLIKGEGKFEKWFSRNKIRLLESEVGAVINSVRELAPKSGEQVDAKMKLIRYIKKNIDRMDYKSFRAKGLQIGSGAIEAAHRTVVQARMKKSGQRWTDEGAQNMLNLRVAFKSGRWEIVKNKICSNLAA